MSWLKNLVKKYPKLSAALGAGLIAAGYAYSPMIGKVIEQVLAWIAG